MGFHSSGWFAYLRYDEERDRPAITRELVGRVWDFARPYQARVIGLLFTILLISGISLVSPLLFRDSIDNAIPNEDRIRLGWLAVISNVVTLVAMLAVMLTMEWRLMLLGIAILC